jgi:ankyrin repeat protein
MLMLYCEEGNYDEVFNLVESKLGNPTPSDAHHSAADHFDIDNQSNNDNGLTPLAMAIKHHHLQIAEYLITRGARVNSVNKVSSLVKHSNMNIDEAVNPF